jgi:hypothetical protein
MESPVGRLHYSKKNSWVKATLLSLFYPEDGAAHLSETWVSIYQITHCHSSHHKTLHSFQMQTSNFNCGIYVTGRIKAILSLKVYGKKKSTHFDHPDRQLNALSYIMKSSQHVWSMYLTLLLLQYPLIFWCIRTATLMSFGAGPSACVVSRTRGRPAGSEPTRDTCRPTFLSDPCINFRHPCL